jgi:hypothetical protein
MNRRKDMHDKINEFLTNHKTAGRILLAIALVTQIVTLYVIVTLLYENRHELYDALKDSLKYIFKGEI